MHWRRKWQPTPEFLPGESQDRGAWWDAAYEVAQSQTRLKRLSSSSSSSRIYKESYYKQLAHDSYIGFLSGTVVKNLPAMQETTVRFLGWEDPVEKEMATHTSILAWRIPWTEEPGRL